MGIEDWNEDSILSRAGYKADGSQTKIARTACINHAIDDRLENALEVLRHLRWLLDDRGFRYPKARKIWKEDIEYACRLINEGMPGNDALVKYETAQLCAQQEMRNIRTKDIFAGLRR